MNYNMARLTIGATDFSTSEYSYSTVPGDYAMHNFTLAHDLLEIVPMIVRAIKINPDIEFLATPWSPPAWLKRNKHMRNSKSPGLVQDTQSQQAYALYISRYISEMARHGINVTRLTVQNEPHVKGQFAATYPCCGFDGEQERDFLRDFLGPRLRTDHPLLQIYIHDDQKDIMVDYVTTILSDTKAAAFVDGAAFHWYGANLKNYQYLQQVHSAFPQLPLLATESALEAPAAQKIGTTPWREAIKFSVDIVGDLNAWTTGWLEWNLLLDASGGPTCIGPSGTGICTPLVGHCDAPILADTKRQTLEVRDSFWQTGHFSRFLTRNSTVVDISVGKDTGLNATAALTPDGDLVVIVVNTDEKNAKSFTLQLEGLGGSSNGNAAALEGAKATSAVLEGERRGGGEEEEGVRAGGGSVVWASVTIPPHGTQTLVAKKG